MSDFFIKKSKYVKSPRHWSDEDPEKFVLLYKEDGILYRICSGPYKYVKEDFIYFNNKNGPPEWLKTATLDEKHRYYIVTLKEKNAITNS